ncbi:glycine cleavage system protein GcvH [bacterium]|nr:glycine cleavage system protein GcvH [candidate division CSSED10-310 bacterium]
MSYPSDYKYSKDHEYVNVVDDTFGIVGITDHAQEQLGDVVFVELPEVGKKLEKGDVFGVVESVKAVVDCYMPVTGEIVAVNEELESQAELVNSDPHSNGWMIKIKIEDLSELDQLMDKAAYENYLQEQ